MALQVLFMMLGAGLGFAIYNPITEENPVADLSMGAAVIQGLSAVLALWFGGWVAGRFTPVAARDTGALHGFSVWCTATVAGVLIVALGAGWVLGDLSKLVGGGLSLAGKPMAAVAGGVADLAKDAVKQSGDTLASFAEEALAHRPANAATRAPAAGIRAKRELGFALARFFNPIHEAEESPAGDKAAKRAAVQKALVEASGLSESEAEKMVADWTASYDRLRADLAAAKNAAAAKARVAADKAAGTLALLSLCAFAAFLLGAASAAYGGYQGARFASKAENEF